MVHVVGPDYGFGFQLLQGLTNRRQALSTPSIRRGLTKSSSVSGTLVWWFGNQNLGDKKVKHGNVTWFSCRNKHQI